MRHLRKRARPQTHQHGIARSACETRCISQVATPRRRLQQNLKGMGTPELEFLQDRRKTNSKNEGNESCFQQANGSYTTMLKHRTHRAWDPWGVPSRSVAQGPYRVGAKRNAGPTYEQWMHGYVVNCKTTQ